MEMHKSYTGPARKGWISQGHSFFPFIFSLFLCSIFCASAYAVDYYVDSISGSDLNSGTAQNKPWKTIRRVNAQSYTAGDNIKFRRGAEWEEQLTLASSGLAGKPITVCSYGSGPNPLIKASNSFNDWRLALSEGDIKIWQGKITGVKNSFGAVLNGSRLPRYYKYNKKMSVPSSLSGMNEGFFYSPYNSGEFFYRSDKTRPPSMEIGARKYGVFVKGQKNIVIDGIDVTGPGGREDNGPDDEFFLVVIDSSDNVTLRNATLTNHVNGGAQIRNNSTNCRYENVVSYGHGSTGLYFSKAGLGNSAERCTVSRCGNLVSDYADMGLIGIWSTPGVTVDGCFLYGNGHVGIDRIDAAVSFVQSQYGTVRRCYLKDIGGTGIQFAENSDKGVAEFNVINMWGVFSAKNMNEGIRIGGGYASSSARNCGIYNNLLMNGGKTKGYWAAVKIEKRYNEGLEVQNNIFYNNDGIFEIIAESLDSYKAWVFSNNIYFKMSGQAVSWAGKRYEYAKIIGKKNGYYSFDQSQDANSHAGDPLLAVQKGKNFDIFKLMTNSPCWGRGFVRSMGAMVSPSGISGKNIGPFNDIGDPVFVPGTVTGF